MAGAWGLKGRRWPEVVRVEQWRRRRGWMSFADFDYGSRHVPVTHGPPALPPSRAAVRQGERAAW